MEWLSNDSGHMACDAPCDVTCSMVITYKALFNSTLEPLDLIEKLRSKFQFALVPPHFASNLIVLLVSVKCPSMARGTQEDAHEFMRILLGVLETEYLAKYMHLK